MTEMLIAFVLVFTWPFGVLYQWWHEHPPSHVDSFSHHRNYDNQQRIVLPVESFGANQHIQVFRPGIPFPDNFTPALARALAAADKWHETYPDMPVAITTAPRTYYVRHNITLSAKSGNVWLVGAPTTYHFTNPSASFIVNVEKENP